MNDSSKCLARGSRAVCLAVLWLAVPSSFVLGSEPSNPQQAEAVHWERAAITELRESLPTDDVSPQLDQLHKAAAAGRAVAQLQLARLYWDGRWVPKDQRRALQLFEAAARSGLAPAQSAVGWINASGVIGARDVAVAERWFIAAAKQGDAYAAGMLARLYWTQPPSGKSPEFSKRLLRRAAELGDNQARVALAQTLLYGPKEGRDPSMAEYLLLQAAQMGDAAAAYSLGAEYLSGSAFKLQLEEGARWISEAHKQKLTPASLWLSDLTARGIGVQEDAELAEKLLSDALRNASIGEKNQFAWQLAVHPDAHLRNPELALKVIEPALAAVDAPEPAHVDTLAAAYAASGRFEAAVEAQQRAMELARARKRGPSHLVGMQERLELYRKGIPFFEERS